MLHSCYSIKWSSKVKGQGAEIRGKSDFYGWWEKDLICNYNILNNGKYMDRSCFHLQMVFLSFSVGKLRPKPTNSQTEWDFCLYDYL